MLRQISLLFQFLTDSCLYLLEARGEDLNSSADILVCSREIDFELVFHILAELKAVKVTQAGRRYQ